VYFKSVGLIEKGGNSFKIIKGYNIVWFTLNISITRKKIYKGQCFLESKFVEEYILFVYLLEEYILIVYL